MPAYSCGPRVPASGNIPAPRPVSAHGAPDRTTTALTIDDQQFARLFLPHLDAAYNLARHLARDEALAEDIVQDAYLRALRHRHGFRGGSARAWLLTIVRRAFYSQWQQAQVTVGIEEFDEETHGAARIEDGPEAALERTLAREHVNAALATLPAPYREVLVLREIEELSYEEIAHVIAAPLGTVMSRLSRARARLQRALGGLAAETPHA